MKFNVTFKDIEDLKPCHNLKDKFKIDETWQGTLLDILESSAVTDADKIWTVTKLLDEKTARLFAVYCAREAVKKLTVDVDVRITACIEVAERFANGQATEEERSAARSAAWSAAESAAWSAARSAAWSAAWSAAESAAWSAARSAAESAVRSAAESAARFAVRSAAESAFVTKLVEMIKERRQS